MSNEFVARNGVIALSNSQVTGSFLVTGNVGVGTTNPTAKLQVNSSAGNYGIVNTNGTVTIGTYIEASNGYASFGTQTNHGLGLFTNNAAPQIYINTSGNVGIGTASPTQRLSVLGNAQVKPSTGTDAVWSGASNDSGEFYLGIDNSAGSGFTGTAYARFLYATNFYPITFHTNNSERMRIAAGGNVGIGTESPTAILHISSSTPTVRLTAGSYTSGFDMLMDTGGTAYLYNRNNGSLNFGTNNTERVKITNEGNVLIYQNLTITGSLISSGSTATANSVVLAASGGFSKSFAIINNSNIQATDVGTFPVWRCNVPCTASMVLMYQDSGSSVDVNAAKNGNNLLSSNLTNSSLNTWVSSSTLQNQNFVTGDILSFQLVGFTGTPKEVTIQTSFNY